MIDGGKIKEIWVYDGITAIQENQFTSGIFDNVVEIHFFDTVNYIGKSACHGIETLKEVYVDSMDCKIDYEDSEGNIHYTLGNGNGSIKIICYEGSSAYDYVTVWNDNYPNSYKPKLY